MVDARLPARWLQMMQFDALSDEAWRVFTGGLMWCVANSTDGHVPARYLKELHPGGVKPAAYDEILAGGLWEETTDGYQFIEWRKVLGQSTAQEVEDYLVKGRVRAQRSRDNQKERIAALEAALAEALASSPAEQVVQENVRPNAPPHVGKARLGKATLGKAVYDESSVNAEAVEVDPHGNEVPAAFRGVGAGLDPVSGRWVSGDGRFLE